MVIMVFLDSSGQLYSGEDQFVASLTKALGSLRSKSKGQALVDNLINSTNNVEVANRKENKADTNGTYILWNPTLTSGGPDNQGGSTRPSFIGLGHEMGHIQDVWNKTFDSSIWSGSVTNAEKYATHIENQLRSEHGIPLRAYYGKTIIGAGDPATQILSTGTRASLFYKKTVTIRNISISTTPYIY